MTSKKVKNRYLFFTFSILIVYPIGPNILSKLIIDGEQAPHSILAIFSLETPEYLENSPQILWNSVKPVDKCKNKSKIYVNLFKGESMSLVNHYHSLDIEVFKHRCCALYSCYFSVINNNAKIGD